MGSTPKLTLPDAGRFRRRIVVSLLIFVTLSAISFVGIWRVGLRMLSEIRQIRAAAESTGGRVDESVDRLRSSLRLFRLFSENPVMRAWGVLPRVDIAYKVPHDIGEIARATVATMDAGGTTIIKEAAGGRLFGSSRFIDVQSATRIAAAAKGANPAIEKLVAPTARLHDIVSSSLFLHRLAPRTDRLLQMVRAGQHVVKLAETLPQLAGAETPRRYFFALTTPAELRGFQGLIGNYAVATLDNGRLSIDEVGSNLDLKDPLKLSSHVSPGYADVFGANNFEWLNVNLSPFVDDAGVQVNDAWKAMRRPPIDAVIFVDTVALSGLVEGSLDGLTSAGGASLTNSAELQEYLSRGVYFEFGEDQIARKNFQTDLANSLLTRFMEHGTSLAAKSKSLVEWLIDGRIGFWDARTNSEGDGLWRAADKFDSSDVIVSFNNIAGNKADTYLSGHATRSRSVPNLVDGFITSLDIDLTSTLQSDDKTLPDYIRRRLDFGLDETAPPASVLEVAFVVGKSTTVTNFMLNGVLADVTWIPLTNDSQIAQLSVEVSADSPVHLHLELKNRGRAPSVFLAPLSKPWTEVGG